MLNGSFRTYEKEQEKLLLKIIEFHHFTKQVHIFYQDICSYSTPYVNKLEKSKNS